MSGYLPYLGFGLALVIVVAAALYRRGDGDVSADSDDSDARDSGSSDSGSSDSGGGDSGGGD